MEGGIENVEGGWMERRIVMSARGAFEQLAVFQSIILPAGELKMWFGENCRWESENGEVEKQIVEERSLRVLLICTAE